MSTNAINPNESIHQANDSETGPQTGLGFVLLLATVILLAYAPSLIEHFRVLWKLEQYQYFPFVIAAVLWLSWSRWHEATPRTVQRSQWTEHFTERWLPTLCVLLSIVTLGVAVYSQWGWFAAVSFNLLALAGILILTQHFHIRNAWGIWALLWLMVPPPIEFGANVVQRMQLASSLMSSQVLDLLGIDHLMTGNVFSLPTKQLFVDEACSGIVSVMSVIAATGIYAVYKDRSLIHAGLLLTMSVIWALIMNTIRIVVVAMAEAWWGFNLAEGTPHELLGLVLFSMTFVASMSTDQFIEFCTSPITASVRDADVNRNSMVKAWNWVNTLFTPKYLAPVTDQRYLNSSLARLLSPKMLAAGIPIAAIGTWSALVFLGLAGGKPAPHLEALVLSQNLDAGSLPATIDDWNQTEFVVTDRSGGENMIGNYDFGQYSHQYTYEAGNLRASVSIDFPFTGGWHELSACYRASGWTILDRTATTDDSGGYVETTFKFPNEDRYGYLVFNNFSDQGEICTPPSGAILIRSWLFIRRRFLRRITGDLYQLQAFIVSDSPLDDQQKAEVKALFLNSSNVITPLVASLSET